MTIYKPGTTFSGDKVLPFEGSTVTSFAIQRPQTSKERTRYIYYQRTQVVPENTAFRVLNRPHIIAAIADIPSGGAEGVLLSHGSSFGGYTLFIKDGKLHYVHNYVGAKELHLVSREDVPEGRIVLSYKFEPTGKPDIGNGKGTQGTGRLYFNEQQVSEMEIPVTMPVMIGVGGGLAVGQDAGSQVTDIYEPPFDFTGTIHRVIVDVSGDSLEDHEAEIRAALARQ